MALKDKAGFLKFAKEFTTETMRKRSGVPATPKS